MENEDIWAACAGCDYSDYRLAESEDYENVTYCKKYDGFVREKQTCDFAVYERFKSVINDMKEENQ